jgi:hypothetical protein
MKTLWLLSGLGVGAGVMSLLDPEKGAGRRDLVRGSLETYGRQTGLRLDETGRSLGRQAQAVLATRRLPFRHQPALEERRRPQGEAGGLSLGFLGWVGLGVGLGSLLEPQGGPQRRAWLRDTVCTYWQRIEGVRRSDVPARTSPRTRPRQPQTPPAHQP